MTAVAFPDTLFVEVEFTAGAWTDITAYVSLTTDSIEWAWGRSSPFDTTSAGSLSLVLHNTDGRFTPNSAVLTSGSANPYYPNIAENKRIRVRTTHSAVTRTQFIGYIDAWSSSFAGGESQWAQVSITASDRFKPLARRVLAALAEEQARYYGALAFWSLASGSEISTADVVTGRIATYRMPGTTGASITYGAGPTASEGGVRLATESPSSSSPALRFGVTSGLRRDYSFWWLLESFGAFDGGTQAISAPDFYLQYGTAGLTLGGYPSGASATAPGDYADDTWHHYFISDVLDGAGNRSTDLYIDGIFAVNVATTGATIFPARSCSLKGTDSTGKPLDYCSAQFSALGIFDGTGYGVLSTAQVAASLALTASPELATDRFRHVLTLAGVAAADIATPSTATADVYVQSSDLQGIDVLSYIQQMGTADSGIVDAHSTVTLTGVTVREPSSTALAAAVVFDVGNDIDASSLALTLADEVTATRVTASSPVGDAVADTGANPATSDSIDAPWNVLDDAFYAAQWRLRDRQAARLRFATITIDPTTASTDRWGACLALNLSDLLSFTGLNPTTCGGRSQTYQFVEGIKWALNLNHSTVQLDTSRWDRDHATVYVEDTLLGRVTCDAGASTVATVSALSGTGTGTFTNAGVLWSTAVGDYPTTVKIHEEEMTISGVTSATIPQTFTISARGVNGTVAAAHATGASIEVSPVPVVGI